MSATMDSTAITTDGQRLAVRFDRYGLDAYPLFLRAKTLPESELSYDWEQDAYTITAPARFAGLLGVPEIVARQDHLPLSAHLFDYQRWIVEMALDAKRLACWIDTGLGKSHVFAEWARQVMHITGGRVLILSPVQIIPQTQEIAREWFGLDIERVQTRQELAAWCQGEGPDIGIASHHALVSGVLPELRYCAGVVLDEASILKAGGGVIKWNLIKSARGIEYKLSCTATPAPNDTMEYASQASFLEKLRHEGEILWTYFSRDKWGRWYVKPHAQEAFYRFMASWSIYMRNPAHFGFRDILADLPPPEIREYQVPLTAAQREHMHRLQVRHGTGLLNDRLGVKERSKFSQLAKGFLYETAGGKRTAVRIESRKPQVVADLVREEVADGYQVLVWTVFDEESVILQEELVDVAGVTVLSGTQTEHVRLAALEGFRRGEVRVLVSKAQLLGYGLNLQHCQSMVFSGFDDSFERMYQSVRRAYRYGQTETVRVHIPYVPELEGTVLGNVKAKEAAFMTDVAIQEEQYRKALAI